MPFRAIHFVCIAAGLVLAAQSSVATFNVPLVAVPGILVGPVQVNPPAPLCTKFGQQCIGDCRNFMVCSRLNAPAARTDACPADRPFCVNDACVAQPDPANDACQAQPNVAFVCTAAGTFPDPFTCSGYYTCAGAAPTAAIQFRCPTGSLYDSLLQSCMAKAQLRATPPELTVSDDIQPLPAASPLIESRTWNTVRTACTASPCPRRFVGTVAYAANPVYFVRCVSDTERIVSRCPDELNHVYDAQLGECVHRCTAVGNFVDRIDCHRFWTCSRRGSRFEVVHNACAERFWFTGRRCEREGAAVCVPLI